MTQQAQKVRRDDGTALVDLDPWLEPYSQALRDRFSFYIHAKGKIDQLGGLLGQTSLGHKYFGLNRGTLDGTPTGQPGVWYREWAPAAKGLALIGDFNGWDRGANHLV